MRQSEGAALGGGEPGGAVRVATKSSTSEILQGTGPPAGCCREGRAAPLAVLSDSKLPLSNSSIRRRLVGERRGSRLRQHAGQAIHHALEFHFSLGHHEVHHPHLTGANVASGHTSAVTFVAPTVLLADLLSQRYAPRARFRPHPPVQPQRRGVPRRRAASGLHLIVEGHFAVQAATPGGDVVTLRSSDLTSPSASTPSSPAAACAPRRSRASTPAPPSN